MAAAGPVPAGSGRVLGQAGGTRQLRLRHLSTERLPGGGGWDTARHSRPFPRGTSKAHLPMAASGGAFPVCTALRRELRWKPGCGRTGKHQAEELDRQSFQDQASGRLAHACLGGRGRGWEQAPPQQSIPLGSQQPKRGRLPSGPTSSDPKLTLQGTGRPHRRYST